MNDPAARGAFLDLDDVTIEALRADPRVDEISLSSVLAGRERVGAS